MKGQNRTKAIVAVFAAAALTLSSWRASADTAYVANEATATISVIDTKTNTITTTIGLGSDPAIPVHLSPMAHSTAKRNTTAHFTTGTWIPTGSG